MNMYSRKFSVEQVKPQKCVTLMINPLNALCQPFKSRIPSSVQILPAGIFRIHAASVYRPKPFVSLNRSTTKHLETLFLLTRHFFSAGRHVPKNRKCSSAVSLGQFVWAMTRFLSENSTRNVFALILWGFNLPSGDEQHTLLHGSPGKYFYFVVFLYRDSRKHEPVQQKIFLPTNISMWIMKLFTHE